MTTFEPSEFTTELATRIAEKVFLDGGLETDFIERQYREIAHACGLKPTGADPLHISDICSLVIPEIDDIKKMGFDDATRYIFELIDLH